MEEYQREFINFAIEQNVLKFGSFTLKSGRVSPYFFNVGMFCSGKTLSKLGHFYATALYNSKISYDLIFGPAYKGIPIAVATAMALAEEYNEDYPYCFNRKEIKDHGEGGSLVGSPLTGDVMLLDDVITAGTAIRESMQLINASHAKLAGVLVAIDRQEKGQGELSAIQEIVQDYHCHVITIVTLDHIIEYLETDPTLKQHTQKMKDYQDEYGISIK